MTMICVRPPPGDVSLSLPSVLLIPMQQANLGGHATSQSRALYMWLWIYGVIYKPTYGYITHNQDQLEFVCRGG
jgi:hypothetical protein